MRIYGTLMVMILAVLFMASHTSAQDSQEEFEAFDRKYCTELDGYEYCLSFHRLPVGPGYAGEAYLSWTDITAVFGPVDEGKALLGKVNSRDGKFFYFQGQELHGLFDRNRLVIFQDLIILEEKE